MKDLHFVCPRCSYVSELLVDLGVEAKNVEATDVEELKVATEELPCNSPAASVETPGELVDLL